MPEFVIVARLPRDFRDKWNHWLNNGWMGIRLVERLKCLPEVNDLLQTNLTNPSKSKWIQVN